MNSNGETQTNKQKNDNQRKQVVVVGNWKQTKMNIKYAK